MPAISFGRLPTYVMLLPINKSFLGYFAAGVVSSPVSLCVAHVELLSSGLTFSNTLPPLALGERSVPSHPASTAQRTTIVDCNTRSIFIAIRLKKRCLQNCLGGARGKFDSCVLIEPPRADM